MGLSENEVYPQWLIYEIEMENIMINLGMEWGHRVFPTNLYSQPILAAKN